MSEEIPKAFRDAFPPEKPRVEAPRLTGLERWSARVEAKPEPDSAGWWNDHPTLAGTLGTLAVYVAFGLLAWLGEHR